MFDLFNNAPVLRGVVFALFFMYFALDMIRRYKEKKAHAAEWADALSKLGLVESSAIFSEVSRGNIVDAMRDGRKLREKYLSKPGDLAKEAKVALEHMATSPDGLKILTDVVAAATKVAVVAAI